MHITDGSKSEEGTSERRCQDCIFSFMELTTESKSKSIILKNKSLLIFLLKGEIALTSEDHGGFILQEKEFLLIQSSMSVKLCMKPNSRLVKLGFRYPLSGSDSPILEKEKKHAICSELKNEVVVRSMNDHLTLYFNQIELYFQDGMTNHNALHDIKLKELSFILKEYYEEDILFSCLPESVTGGSQFKDKVTETYLKAKTVVELAEMCGYGLKSFQRMFNLHFGETPYQWMRKQMAKHIEEKLKDPSIPIKQIVAEYGFSSVSHFNTFCKKYFGMTPKKVRNKSNIR